MKLKKYLLATALVGLGSAPTLAADLAARPYTKAPALAAVYDWTGFYIGVNAGVGLGRDRLQHDLSGIGFAYSFYTSPQGGFGGGQIGYNWQTGSVFGPIVFGVEADIQGGGLSDDHTNFSGCSASRAYRQKLDWFGTARGRIGIANGPVLSYVTAGYAFGKRQDQRDPVGARSTSFSTDRIAERMGRRQRRRSRAGRQLDRQDRVSLPQSRQQDRYFDALCRNPDQYRNSRKHLSGRSELSDRRQGLCAGRCSQLGRLLSRRQFRFRHRAGSQFTERAGGDDF